MQTVGLLIGILIIGVIVIMYRTNKDLEKIRQRTESYLEEQQVNSK